MKPIKLLASLLALMMLLGALPATSFAAAGVEKAESGGELAADLKGAAGETAVPAEPGDEQQNETEEPAPEPAPAPVPMYAASDDENDHTGHHTDGTPSWANMEVLVINNAGWEDVYVTYSGSDHDNGTQSMGVRSCSTADGNQTYFKEHNLPEDTETVSFSNKYSSKYDGYVRSVDVTPVFNGMIVIINAETDENGLHTVSFLDHLLEYYPAKPASCQEKGNIEYWYCVACGSCYTDAAAAAAVDESDAVIAPYGAHVYENGVCTRCGSADISGLTVFGNDPLPGYDHTDFFEITTNPLGDGESEADAYDLFDGGLWDWSSYGSTDEWIAVFESARPITVCGVLLTTSYDAEYYYNYNPSAWKLWGYDEAVGWEMIYQTASASLPAANSADYAYRFTGNGKQYSYFKFEVTEVVDGSSYSLYLGELRLLSTDPLELTVYSGALFYTDSQNSAIDYTFPYGAEYTLPDPGELYGSSNAAYFQCWKDTTTDVTYAPGDTLVLTRDTIIEAQWNTYTFTLTNSVNDNTFVFPVVPETTYTLPDDPFNPLYHVLENWTDSTGGYYSPGYTVYVNGSRSFEAVYRGLMIKFKNGNYDYDIRFTEDGSFTIPDFFNGDEQDINTPMMPGQPQRPVYGQNLCAFLMGWEYEGVVYHTGDTLTGLTEDIEMQPVWALPAVIKINAIVDDSSLSTSLIVPEGGYTLPDYPFDTLPQNMTFAGWVITELDFLSTNDNTVYQAGDAVDVVYEIVLQAQFTPGVTVSFDANGGWGEMADLHLAVGESLTLPECGFSSGTAFDKWLANNEYKAPGDVVSFTQNAVIRAIWTESGDHAVYIDYNDGSANNVVVYRSFSGSLTLDLPECSRTCEGYDFDCWLVNGNFKLPGNSLTLTNDTLITAIWAKHCVVTYDAGGGSGPSVVSGGAKYYTSYTLPANPYTKENCSFIGWRVNGAVKQPGSSFTVVDDITVTAVWLPYPVVSFDQNGGTGTMDGVCVASGETLTLPACAFTKTGHFFAGWQIGETTYQPGDTYAVSGNAVAKALWTKGKTVTFDTNGGVGAMAPAVVETGSYYTLPACTFTRQGYYFTGWQIGGNVTVRAPGYEYKVNNDSTVKAVWAVNYYIEVEPTSTGAAFKIKRHDETTDDFIEYRTVSKTALAGVHFTEVSGYFNFEPGDPEVTVTVEHTAFALVPLTDRYSYNVSSRFYTFELMNDFEKVLTSVDRTISYNSSYIITNSNVFGEKTVTVLTGEKTINDKGFKSDNNGYTSVPISNYFASALPQAYLTSIGASLRMKLEMNVKEVDDGYQFIQILVNQTSNADTGNSNNSVGDINYATYLASFCHKPGTKYTTYEKYCFPVLSAGDDCAAVSEAWNFSPYNNAYGRLNTQKFNGSRASDGRLILPVNLNTLGLRFDASGDSDDDWVMTNVYALIQAVDSTAPSVKSVYAAPGRYGYGDSITVCLQFDEIVLVTGTPNIRTGFGSLSYAGGSGTSVLYFTGTLSGTSSVSALSVTGITGGTIKDLAGNTRAAFTATTVPGDVSYVAPVTATIKYGPSNSNTATFSLRRGDAFKFPDPTPYLSEGHTFASYAILTVMGVYTFYEGSAYTASDNYTAYLGENPIRYPVSFLNDDGALIASENVAFGSTPAYAETPTKESTAQYSYTFAGWRADDGTVYASGELPAITADATFTAVYTESTRQYTVTWLSGDGSVMCTQRYYYGLIPSNPVGNMTVPESNAMIRYSAFSGHWYWDRPYEPVRGDTTYTPVFSKIAQYYTINWYAGDTLITTTTLPYGVLPTRPTVIPTIDEDAQYIYEWTGFWTPGIDFVKNDATYSAIFEPIEKYYTVTFVNYDGTVLQTGRLPYGSTPVYGGTTPIRSDPGASYRYVFNGWTPEISAVTEDVTYTATFMTDWATLNDRFAAASTDSEDPTVITLMRDCVASPEDEALLIPEGRYVVLDLNGYILDRNLSAATENGYVIMVKGSLTITDSSPDTYHFDTTLKGGVITGGYCSGSAGGVYVRGGTLVMNGGSIAGNVAKFNGGVCVASSARFTLTNGRIIDNTATNDNGGGVGVYGGCVFTMSGGAILDNVSAGYAGGVYVYKGTFNMSDGAICGNKADEAAGGGVVVDIGTFNLTGGSIAGNTASYGGGVYMTDSGTFNMSGGSITGNAAGTYGGGVYVSSGTFNMSGGSITGNAAEGYAYAVGGGVYVSNGDFTMLDGRISGNTAIKNGGGVFMNNDNAVFTMTGGEITNNEAESGGGVYQGQGAFHISGSPIIAGNTRSSDETANNVYIVQNGVKITVTDTLTGAACIGVTTPNTTPALVFTSGLSGNGSAANFFSDNTSYGVCLNGDGEAAFAWAYSVYIDSGIAHGSVASDRASAVEGQTVTLTVTPEEGYTLDTLTVTDSFGDEVTVTNGAFTMPSCYVTVTATFTETQPAGNKYDLNRDDEVDVGDVTALLNFLASMTGYDEFYDLDEDGEVTVADVTHLLNYLASAH